MENHPDVVRAIELIGAYGGGGWAEYYLWEYITNGKWPFWYRAEMPYEESDVLVRVRDELKVWPFFHHASGTWKLAAVEDWTAHAAETSGHQAVARCTARYWKTHRRAVGSVCADALCTEKYMMEQRIGDLDGK
jgi:hypothetical protein